MIGKTALSRSLLRFPRSPFVLVFFILASVVPISSSIVLRSCSVAYSGVFIPTSSHEQTPTDRTTTRTGGRKGSDFWTLILRAKCTLFRVKRATNSWFCINLHESIGKEWFISFLQRLIHAAKGCQMHTHTHTYRGRPTLVAIDGKKTVERRVGAAEKGLIDEDVFFGLCTKIWTQLAVSHRKPDKHQFLLLPSHKRTHFRSVLLIRHGRTHAIWEEVEGWVNTHRILFSVYVDYSHTTATQTTTVPSTPTTHATHVQ